MRPAREVIGDDNVAALRAEGLVIVAAADVAYVVSVLRPVIASEGRKAMIDRLDAALAAGGTDGE